MCVYGINYSEQIEDKKVSLEASVGVPTGVGLGAAAGISIWTVASSIALAPATGGASLFFGAASALVTAGGTAAVAEACERHDRINNDKGSTIKLVNEMSESNGKLGEKDSWLSDRIKANIEVPTKKPCRIM
jgi:high-affinity Fe2+/Pb2+ permease